MAKAEDADPMLSLPYQPASGHLGPVVRVAAWAVFLFTVQAVLQNTTKCDKAISMWIEWVLDLAIIAILREAVGIAGAKGRGMKVVTISVVSAAVGMWLYGHLLVYMSEKCDVEMWYLAFLLLLWLDVAALFLFLALCCLPRLVLPSNPRISP